MNTNDATNNKRYETSTMRSFKAYAAGLSCGATAMLATLWCTAWLLNYATRLLAHLHNDPEDSAPGCFVMVLAALLAGGSIATGFAVGARVVRRLSGRVQVSNSPANSEA